MTTAAELEDFIYKLERHDWRYEYSDDGRVCHAGGQAHAWRAADRRALEAIAKTDSVLAQAMLAVQVKYCGQGNYADRVLRCADQLNTIRDSLKEPT